VATNRKTFNTSAEELQYAHVMLFACPQCGRPLCSSCASPNKNLEIAEAQWFAPHCHCGWTGEVAGVTAVRHWVEPWSAAPVDEPGTCD